MPNQRHVLENRKRQIEEVRRLQLEAIEQTLVNSALKRSVLGKPLGAVLAQKAQDNVVPEAVRIANERIQGRQATIDCLAAQVQRCIVKLYKLVKGVPLEIAPGDLAMALSAYSTLQFELQNAIRAERERLVAEGTQPILRELRAAKKNLAQVEREAYASPDTQAHTDHMLHLVAELDEAGLTIPFSEGVLAAWRKDAKATAAKSDRPVARRPAARKDKPKKKPGRGH